MLLFSKKCYCEKEKNCQQNYHDCLIFGIFYKDLICFFLPTSDDGFVVGSNFSTLVYRTHWISSFTTLTGNFWPVWVNIFELLIRDHTSQRNIPTLQSLNIISLSIKQLKCGNRVSRRKKFVFNHFQLFKILVHAKVKTNKLIIWSLKRWKQRFLPSAFNYQSVQICSDCGVLSEIIFWQDKNNYGDRSIIIGFIYTPKTQTPRCEVCKCKI